MIQSPSRSKIALNSFFISFCLHHTATQTESGTRRRPAVPSGLRKAAGLGKTATQPRATGLVRFVRTPGDSFAWELGFLDGFERI